MITIFSTKVTANEAARYAVHTHGATAIDIGMDEFTGVEISKATEKEKEDLARLISKHVERLNKLLNIEAIDEKIYK